MPARRRGAELLDDPRMDATLRERAHRDIVRSNLLFGGTRAVLLALGPVLAQLAPQGRRTRTAVDASLLDVGTGLGDIPWKAREFARRRGVRLRTFGLDGAPTLAVAARRRVSDAVCGDALSLPFADRSFDVVVCSQLVHHFEEPDGVQLLAELDRVARRRVIVSDLRRSWVGAVAFWLASVALRFHSITRHDGTLSVLRGFTEGELGGMVQSATGGRGHPAIRRRLGFRITVSWTPAWGAPIPS
jgi:SAM-dependent methyltransferase